MYDDNSGGGYGGGFGGLGSSLGNFFSNPMTLAAIQMMGNNTPKINAIPNTLEGVPTVLMSAQDRQRKAQADALQRQKEAAEQNAITEALKSGGVPADVARSLAPSLPGVKLYQGYQDQKRDAEELDRYSRPPTQQQPQPAPYQPTPAAAAPQDPAALQQALASASSKFDKFGQASVGKTVAEAAGANAPGDQTAAARFVDAARKQGLSPDTLLTKQILSDPNTAMPLAKSLGVGADLPDDQWQQAHSDALQAARARRAAQQAAQAQQQAAAQQAQQQPPAAPYTQTGASPAVQVGPAQNTVQPAGQNGPAQNTEQPQQQQVPPNATATARAAYAQNRIKELEGKLDYELRFSGSKNDRVSVPAKFRAQQIAREIEELRSIVPEMSKAPKYGLQGLPAVDAQGNPVMVQLSDSGVATAVKMPDGVTISKNPIKLDGGDRWILLDPITRQKVAEVGKGVAEEAEQKATGKAQGVAKVALPTVIASAETMLKQIEEVETHKDKSKGVGPLIGSVGGIPYVNQDFVERVDQLKGQAFKTAYETLKGGGSITEIEGLKGEQAIARLSRAKSMEEFDTALKDLKDVVKQGLSVARKKAGASDAAPAAPASGGTTKNGTKWSVE